MGIDRDTCLGELNGFIGSYLGWKNISMIELGNQILDNNETGKKYFSDLGVNHISIDLNGEDGALPLDLCSEIKGIPPVDIVTNFGTSEHVNNQFHCWKNIHNFTLRGGLIFNVVPPSGHWPNHCDHWYTLDFFNRLSELNKYEILKNEIYKNPPYVGDKALIMCVLRKIHNNDFNGIDQSTLASR